MADLNTAFPPSVPSLAAVIRAWRLVKSRYASVAFDGEGARLYGGRWNSRGTLVAYASDSVALAALEVIVHLQSTGVLASYSLASLQFPDESVEDVDASALPKIWRTYPAPPELQAIGDQWVKDVRTAVLRVPNAIIPSAHNYLLNPAHPEFANATVDQPQAFDFDPRLLRF